jgi:hypothetical protein
MCGEIVKKTAIQSEQARTALLSTPCEPFIGLALYGPGLLVTGLC